MKHIIFLLCCISLLLASSCAKKVNPSPIIVISSIFPASGGYDVVVTITGRNFSATASNDTVKFNGIPATVQSATTTTIKALVPLGAGTGPVTISTSTLAKSTGPVFNYNLSPTVYFAGQDGADENAAYWINGKEYFLPAKETNAQVGAMGFNNTDIYFAGEDAENAVYWKNGTEYNLPVAAPGNSYVYSVAFSGTDIYFAGVDSYKPVYWKNGIEIPLPDVNGGNAHQIAIAGTDVYIVGTDNGNAVYWKNGVEISLSELSGSGLAETFTISGTDLYIGGIDGNNPVYWKNGTESTLPKTDEIAYISAMSIFGTGLYFAGVDENDNGRNSSNFDVKVVYWTGGAEIILPTLFPSNISGAGIYTMATAGTDFYIAGIDGDQPVFWKNGIENILSTQPSTYGYKGAIYTMAIVNK